MNDINIKNKRFDPELTPFLLLAKEMAKAFGYTANLSVNKELAQLLRLRVSQHNECAYCARCYCKGYRYRPIQGR